MDLVLFVWLCGDFLILVCLIALVTMSRRNRPRNPSPPPPVDPPQVDTMGIIFNDLTFSNNFLRNSRRRIRPTKFYNDEVANELGVGDDVRMLFEGAGLASWLGLHAPTYKRL